MTPSETIEAYVKENFLSFVHKSGKTVFRYIYYFEIDLPFQLPLPESRRFTKLGVDSKSKKVEMMSQVSFCEKKQTTIIQGAEIELWTSKCRVMVTDTRIISPSITENDLSEAIDRGLNHVNSIIQAYRHTTRDPDVYLQNIQNSAPLVVVMAINTKEWKIKNAGIVNLNSNFPYKKEIISDEKKLSEIERLDNLILNSNNPFMIVNDFQIDALRFHKQALFKEAIISCQTSVEVLLKTLLHHMMKNEGIVENKIESLLSEDRNGFMGLVKAEFHSRLGGKWDIEKPKTPVGNWYKNVYKIRGRVVHAGYVPTHVEADKALAASQEFINYVIGQLRKNKRKYPDLQKYFMIPTTSS